MASQFHASHAAAGVTDALTRLRKATNDNTMPIQQVLTLMAIYMNPDVGMSDLLEYSGVERSSNSRNVDKLGTGSLSNPGLGLVEAYRDPENRRLVRCRMTPKGKVLMDKVFNETATVMNRWLRSSANAQ